jgi:hypothetical protein
MTHLGKSQMNFSMVIEILAWLDGRKSLLEENYLNLWKVDHMNH